VRRAQLAAAVVVAVVVALGAAPAHATDVTVANGADLEAAVAVAQPGQTITLLDGTYILDKAIVAAAAGTAGAPIRLTSAQRAHGAQVVAAPGAEEAILVQAPYWIFDGIDFGGGTYGLRFITAGQNAVVSNALFTDQAFAAIRADCGGPDTNPHCDGGSLQSIEVTRAATVAGCSYAGIEIVGAQAWTVHGALVHNIAVDSLGCAGVQTVYGIAVRGNSSNVLVDSVAVAGAAIGIALGPPSQACEVRGAISNGTTCTTPTACEVSSSLVSNAVVWDTTFEGAQLANACAVNLHNATLWNNGSGGGRSVETSGMGTPDISNVILNVAPTLASGVSNTGSNNLVLPSNADTSWFIDAGTANFRLLASAPAIDTGATLADVPTDFDGITRPQGAHYDVGAFERPTDGYPDGGIPLLDGGTDLGGSSSSGPTGSTGTGLGGTPEPQKSSGCDVGFGAGSEAGALGLMLALFVALVVRKLAR
jgi:hypothetical protein